MILRGRFLHLLLAVGGLLSQLSAQAGRPVWFASTRTETPANSPGNATSASGTTNESGGAETTVPQFSDWPVLVIPGVADLGDLHGAGVVFGVGVSEGYGDVQEHNSTGEPSGSILVTEPYIGAFNAGYRHKLLLEYAPTIDLYNQNRWDGSVLQRGGLMGYRDLSKRLRWVFAAYTTNGTEYLRGLDGLSIGEYPGWLTFTLPTETVFSASSTTGLYWRFKPLKEFLVTASDAYSDVRHGPHYDAGSVRAQLNNYFGRTSQWYVYTQANRYSNQPDCTRIGFGGGIEWNLTSSTRLSVEGGPVYGSGSCFVQWTGNFGGNLIQRITPSTVFYLSAAREMIEPYLLQARWTDVYSAKIEQRITVHTSLGIGAAYAHNSDLPGQSISHYRALLLFSEFRWRLSENFSFVASYRRFKRDFYDPTFHDQDSWVFCSLVWHPVIRGARR